MLPCSATRAAASTVTCCWCCLNPFVAACYGSPDGTFAKPSTLQHARRRAAGARAVGAAQLPVAVHRHLPRTPAPQCATDVPYWSLPILL